MPPQEMTRLTKEMIWTTGTMLAAFAIGLVLFGASLFNGRPLDVQVHDTYYVFPKTFYIISVWVTVIAATYAIRALYKRSNNRLVNIVMAAILTLILWAILPHYNWLYGYVKDAGYYFHNQGTQTDRVSEYVVTYWYLTVVITLIGLIIVTAVYKAIRPGSAK